VRGGSDAAHQEVRKEQPTKSARKIARKGGVGEMLNRLLGLALAKVYSTAMHHLTPKWSTTKPHKDVQWSGCKGEQRATSQTHPLFGRSSIFASRKRAYGALRFFAVH